MHNNKGASQADALHTQQLQNASLPEAGLVLSDRFKVIRQLGKGAQASVFLAYDMLLQTDVALKYIPDANTNPAGMEVLRNEVNIGRKLQHPRILRIHDVYTHFNDAFFTMSFVPGNPLYVRMEKPVSLDRYQIWRDQLLDALMACHVAGISHGDIKPDNILIDEHDELLLIDFGIGHESSQNEHTSGHVAFTAPEVIATGKASATSEIYSAGKVLELVLDAVTVNTKADKRSLNAERKLLSKMTSHSPQARPQFSDFPSIKDGSYHVNTHSFLVVGAVILASIYLMLMVFKFYSTDSVPPVATSGTKRLLLLAAEDVPVLKTINAMVELPLSTSPEIDVIDQHTTSEVAKNLSLQPFINQHDRVDLATTINADIVVNVDAAEASATHWVIRATGRSMPADSVLFDFTHPFSIEQLSADAQAFASQLSEALLTSSSTTVTSEQDTAFISSYFLDSDRFNQADSSDALFQLKEAVPTYPGGWLYAARQALNQNDISACREYLDVLFSLPDVDPFFTLSGQYLRALANDDLELARSTITELNQRYPDRASLLSELGMVMEWAGDMDAAAHAYEQATQQAPGEGQYWFELARIKIINGNISDAINHELTKALVAFRTRVDREGQGLVLNAFGVAHLRLAEYDTASQYFSDALAFRTVNDYPAQRATTLANFANAAAVLGNYDEAAASLNEASDILAELGDNEELAHVLDTLGFLYEEQGQYAKALTYYKRGLDIRVQESNRSEKAASMSNVAFMHFLTGDFSLADIYWQQALNQFISAQDKAHVVRTQQNIAQLSLVKGDWIAASRLLQNTSAEISGNMQQEAMINHLLFSYLQFARGDLTASTLALQQAEALALETTDPAPRLKFNYGMVRCV